MTNLKAVPSINALIEQHYDSIDLKVVTSEMIEKYYNHAMSLFDSAIVGSAKPPRPQGTPLEVVTGLLQPQLLLSDAKAGKYYKEVITRGGLVALLERHAELLQDGHTALNITDHHKFNTLITGSSANSVMVIINEKQQEAAKVELKALVESRLQTMIDLENEALLNVEKVTQIVTELHEKLDKEYKENLRNTALSSAAEAAQKARSRAKDKLTK